MIERKAQFSTLQGIKSHASSSDSMISKNTKAIERNTANIQKNSNDIADLKSSMEKMGDRINGTAALAQANANLFQPYNVGKINVTAAVGGYENAQAIAVGTGYRVNESLAVRGSVGYENGTNHIGYGVGASFEF